MRAASARVGDVLAEVVEGDLQAALGQRADGGSACRGLPRDEAVDDAAGGRVAGDHAADRGRRDAASTVELNTGDLQAAG